MDFESPLPIRQFEFCLFIGFLNIEVLRLAAARTETDSVEQGRLGRPCCGISVATSFGGFFQPYGSLTRPSKIPLFDLFFF